MKSSSTLNMKNSLEFDKMLPRQKDFLIKEPATVAVYQPNKEYVLPKTFRGTLKFKEAPGRHSARNSNMLRINDGSSQNYTSVDYDKVVSALHK